jgi:hypothetical protein
MAVRVLRPEEEWARQVISLALRRTVVQNDDGSADGMHDLSIVSPEGSLSAVEVTSAADGELVAFWRHFSGQGRWIERGLVGRWTVHALPSARAKDLKKRLPDLLQAAEVAGMSEVGRGRSSDHQLVKSAHELRVTHMRQGATDFPGSIYVMPDLPVDRVGGVVPDTGDALSPWIADFLKSDERAGDREKLRRAGTEERHAFVIVPAFGDVPFAVMDLLSRNGAPLPAVAPGLPDEVTHVWAVSTWAVGHGIRWSPDEGWLRFDKEKWSRPVDRGSR